MTEIVLDPALRVDAEGFGLVWKEGALRIPPELGVVLERLRVRSAEQLASVLVAFPTEFKCLGVLGAQFDEAHRQALSTLGQQLDKRLVRLPDSALGLGGGVFPPLA